MNLAQVTEFDSSGPHLQQSAVHGLFFELSRGPWLRRRITDETPPDVRFRDGSMVQLAYYELRRAAPASLSVEQTRSRMVCTYRQAQIALTSLVERKLAIASGPLKARRYAVAEDQT